MRRYCMQKTQKLDDLIENIYKNNSGYRIKENDVDNNICFIYCSSNALYLKGDIKDFKNKIIERNRYEWENIQPKKIPKLEIYIRDIFLSWYVKGISKDISDFESLIYFLKSVTKGYKVRCIGASSGGYIGTMIALKLNCECMSFAGQFSLVNHFDHIEKNTYLRQYVSSYGIDKLELQNIIEDSTAEIFYIVPTKSEQDTIQMNIIKEKKNVYTIRVSTDKHGVALYSFALPRGICYERNKLLSYTGKVYNKFCISCLWGGITSAFKYFIGKIFDGWRKTK